MSAVNFSEVLKKTIARGGDAELMGRLVERASINIVPFDEVHAVDAAELFPKAKDNGLSFADRACLSLAIELNAPLFTADQRLAGVDAPIDAVWIREPAVAVGKKGK